MFFNSTLHNWITVGMAIWDEWENERKGREEEEGRKGMTRPIDKPDDDDGGFSAILILKFQIQ